MPTDIAPMLCEPRKQIPPGFSYLFEEKWDGYRIIAFVEKSGVRLASRNNQDFTSKYPPVVTALKKLGRRVVLDGEIVVVDENGISSFDRLQRYRTEKGDLKFVIFDILWLDGRDLTHLPLRERKEILATVIQSEEVLLFSRTFSNGSTLLRKMEKAGKEGVVAKRTDSLYLSGVRTSDWIKVPLKKIQEFVIAGYAESEKGRPFATLTFGAYDTKGNFKFVGHSGGGYKDKEMPDILKMLQRLEIKKSPFVNKVENVKGIIHFSKPVHVAAFEYSGFTDSGFIRKPATFLGFREDKEARQVIFEVPVKKPKNTALAPLPENQIQIKPARARKHRYLNEDSEWKKVDMYPPKTVAQLDFPACTIDVTDFEKELWPNFSKGQLLFYYSQISQYILPHLRNRPQSLNIKLPKISSDTIFVHDMEHRQPACAAVFTDKRKHPKPGKRTTIDYLLCNNIETLLYMVNVGCVDVNPWASRYQTKDYPDYIFIDLDPTVDKHDRKDHDAGFNKAIKCALAAKEVLKSHKITSFVKTSGKTGLHIYIPCRELKNDLCRSIAEYFCDQIHTRLPRISTREVNKDKRGAKVYLDAGQNDYADTLAAPYSVRPYFEPIISCPLDWREIKPTLDRWKFTPAEILKRLEKKGDIFAHVLDATIAATNTMSLVQIRRVLDL